MSDYLLVGIHRLCLFASNSHHCPHHPIMYVHKCSLNVLTCCYVDNVVIGAPWKITTLDISLVVQETCAEVNKLKNTEGILTVIKSPLDMTMSTIISCIVANFKAYHKGNLKEEESEKQYY
uniref:Uncharacterized protein n=1 Tax=Physcomitrium patens TaxID=3218 RepID=A0A2K1J301_PHYPA|nr:hypothetical protein PHYPA_021758 [Physcomitrium patens]